MAAVGVKKTVSDDEDDFYIAPFIEEPYDPNKIPMYCKRLVYDNGEEFSLEEIRARRYLGAIKKISRSGATLKSSKIYESLSIQKITGPQNEGKMDGRDGPKDISNVLLNDENNLKIYMEGIAGKEDISSNKCPVKISSVLQDVVPEQGICKNSVVRPPAEKQPQQSMEKSLGKENDRQVKNCVSPLDDSIPATTVPELPMVTSLELRLINLIRKNVSRR